MVFQQGIIMTSIDNSTIPDIPSFFDNYPLEIKEKLLQLRLLIFETATTLAVTGGLVETLKWNQPSYLTKSKSGTTIRIDQDKSELGQYALYVHCQTSLIEDCRHLFPDTFTFSGNRALLFNVRDKLPEKELYHFIEMALTYHIKS